MRRCAPFLLLLTAGCTSAPLAGFLDLVAPSKLGRPLNDIDAPPRDLPPPAPPPGVQLQPPVVPAAPPASSGFMPPLSPRDPSPLPPPEPSDPNRRVGPLSVPNT